MSYKEAKEDKIPLSYEGGFPCYHPQCVWCGTLINSSSYIRGKRYLCKKCSQYKKAIDEIEKMEKELMSSQSSSADKNCIVKNSKK